MVINNTLCLVEGGAFLAPGSRNIFAIGGETFSLILFDESGEYVEHSINPALCASGTGAFIEQQAERLGYTVAGTCPGGFDPSGIRPRLLQPGVRCLQKPI